MLENREATTNQTVEFSCQMTQSGTDVVWLRNGQPLSLTEGRYQIRSQDCSYNLVIPNVTTDDVGEYTIKTGEIQSTAVLTVNGWYARVDKNIFINSKNCEKTCLFTYVDKKLKHFVSIASINNIFQNLMK